MTGHFLIVSAVAASATASAFCYISGAALAVRTRSRGSAPAALPAVTCIRPVRGLDPGARENLEALLRQDYPAPVQFLFAIESLEDPVRPLIETLRVGRPDLDIGIVVAGICARGSQKVHNLRAALREARHQVLCVSDSDIRPRSVALRRLVEELESTGAGAVCASVFYTECRGVPARAMQAFANADVVGILAFLEATGRPDVLIGGMHVVTLEALESVGGYDGLGDHISDDGALGMKLFAAGRRVLCSREPAPMILPAATWAEFLTTGHRWWLMARVSAPRRYLLGLFLLGPAYGMALFAAGVLAGRAGALEWLCGPGLCLLHVATTAWVGQVRGPRGMELAYSWLRPAVDLACFPLWWAALLWPQIRWRGHLYRVGADGAAVKVAAPGREPG